jgi:preprotein translocase subunit SecF
MNLMKFRPLYFLISAIFLLPGIVSLIMFGVKPAIDFTGGSLLEFKFDQEVDFDFNTASFSSIETSQIYQISSVQQSGENQYLVRTSNIDNQVKDEILQALGEHVAPVEEVRFETVGPTLGKELLKKTFMAIFVVALMITLYVWKQFKELKFGICAITAMFHDSLILLGIFSLLGKYYGVEVDVLFVTAVLTTLSFSIHDTIVIYDRIRELSKKYPKHDLETVANASVLETLSRSINNSVTIILMLLALVVLGGATIKWFSLALLIGAVAGTYSSTFIAVPLLLVWDEWLGKKK